MKTDAKLIVSLKKNFKLFKSPNRIGDILDYKGAEHLIIGIEKVSLAHSILTVIYTCQNLTMSHSEQPDINQDNDMAQFYSEVDISKTVKDYWHLTKDNLISIGQVFEYEGFYYRWITYTDLVFDFTTLRVSTLAQPIRPKTVSDAKKQLLEHKKKKICLTLI